MRLPPLEFSCRSYCSGFRTSLILAVHGELRQALSPLRVERMEVELGHSGAVTVSRDDLDREVEAGAGCSLWSIAMASCFFLDC